ncbi:UNVERIFIED_CONTAM: DUF3459 domain-containing protein, partial [Salmonella enterica subsp. enterica serovar Weltevreden]
HDRLAIDQQDGDPDSLLALTRKFIRLRNAHPALRWGDIRITGADASLLVFERMIAGERLICAFNLGAEPVACDRAGGPALVTLGEVELARLGAYAAFVARA